MKKPTKPERRNHTAKMIVRQMMSTGYKDDQIKKIFIKNYGYTITDRFLEKIRKHIDVDNKSSPVLGTGEKSSG